MALLVPYLAYVLVAAVVVAGVLMAPGAQRPPALKDEGVPDDDIFAGFSSTPVGNTAPIPVHLGTVMIPGNIVKAHLLGDNNTRILLMLALGEYTGAPDPVLTQILVGGIDFTDLSNYSASRQDNMSWFEFSPKGDAITVPVTNLGRKIINQQVSEGNEYITEAIEIYGATTIDINLNHYSTADGSTQTWSLYYRNGSSGPWVLLETKNELFRVYVEQQVPDGKDTETQQVPAEGYTKSTQTFNLPEGSLYFKLDVTQASNAGAIYFEDIDITAAGGRNVVFQAHGTSFLVLNIQKTKEVSSLKFGIELVYPYSNPVDAIKFLLTDTEFGLGIPDQDIDLASFAAASAWANSNGSEIAISLSNMQFDAAIQKILTAAGLYLSRTGGIFKIFPDIDGEVSAVLDMNADVVSGSFSWGISDYQDGLNRLRAKFADQDDNYSLTDLIVEDTAQVDADGYVREKTIDLTPIRSMSRAQERAETLYKQMLLNNIWCKFALGIRHSAIEVGDIAQIVNDSIGWTFAADRRFRIVNLDEILDDDGLYGHQVTATLHDPAAYLKTYNWNTWTPVASLPVLAGNTDLDQFPNIVITSVTEKVVNSGSGYQSNLTVNFTVPAGYDVAKVKLYGRPGYTSTLSYLGENVASLGSIIVNNVEPYVDWRLIAVAVKTDGTQADPATAIWHTFYPTLAPHDYPGYGGGYYGVQPYGV